MAAVTHQRVKYSLLRVSAAVMAAGRAFLGSAIICLLLASSFTVEAEGRITGNHSLTLESWKDISEFAGQTTRNFQLAFRGTTDFNTWLEIYAEACRSDGRSYKWQPILITRAEGSES